MKRYFCSMVGRHKGFWIEALGPSQAAAEAGLRYSESTGVEVAGRVHVDDESPSGESWTYEVYVSFEPTVTVKWVRS